MKEGVREEKRHTQKETDTEKEGMKEGDINTYVGEINRVSSVNDRRSESGKK